MATIRISALDELLTPAGVTPDDLLQIINVEDADETTWLEGRNRKIRASVLANGLSRLTTTIPTVIQTELDKKISLENFNSAGLKIAVPVVAASPGISFNLSNIIPTSSVDGVTLVSGNRVLLKNQTQPSQNGIYVVQSTGAPQRAGDFDTILEINDGYVLVDGGTTLKGSSWVVTSTVDVIGTDPINFTQFSSAISGLSKSAVGLGNVDNTSDANKPISAATATALAEKQVTITGAASSIVSSDLTASRALVSATDGKVAVSAITSEKLDHLSDVTGKIQGQLNLKANSASPSFSGTVALPSSTTVNGVTISMVPAGAVMAFAMNSAPTGWLACEGQAVLRAGINGYPTLFAAISTTHGSGDNSTTFNLPDLRGYFVRGSGTHGDGTTSGAFGAKQLQDWKSFTLASSFAAYSHNKYMEKQITPSVTSQPGAFGGKWESVLVGGVNTASSLTLSWDTSEIRPKNIALLYCIKY